MAQARESKLLAYLVMMLGLVLGFLYSGASDPAQSVPVLPADLQMASVQSLRNAKIDDAILTSEAFGALKVFGSLPVPTDAGGKTDPFQ